MTSTQGMLLLLAGFWHGQGPPDLAAAEAKLEQAKAECRAAAAQAEREEARWKLIQPLAAKGTISREEVLAAEERLAQARTRLAFCETQVKLLQVELERARGQGKKADPLLVKVGSPVAGIVTSLGTKGALAVGDRVAAGQVLMTLDNRLALLDREQKAGQLKVAGAKLKAAQAIHSEAQARLERTRQAHRIKAVAQEELDAALFAAGRYVAEVDAAKARLHVAEIEVSRAEHVVALHDIRSPVDGVVHAIVKTTGEGVQALETVVIIRVGPAKDK